MTERYNFLPTSFFVHIFNYWEPSSTCGKNTSRVHRWLRQGLSLSISVCRYSTQERPLDWPRYARRDADICTGEAHEVPEASPEIPRKVTLSLGIRCYRRTWPGVCRLRRLDDERQQFRCFQRQPGSAG